MRNFDDDPTPDDLDDPELRDILEEIEDEIFLIRDDELDDDDDDEYAASDNDDDDDVCDVIGKRRTGQWDDDEYN
jgi:hypothetical protein